MRREGIWGFQVEVSEKFGKEERVGEVRIERGERRGLTGIEMGVDRVCCLECLGLVWIEGYLVERKGKIR